MNQKRLVYVAGGGGCSGYSNWMGKTGYAKSIEDADLVLGLGGADVSAHYYNQPNSGLLNCSSDTDKKEHADFQKAIQLGKKIIGICKSSQFAAALAGGAIFQHVNHPYLHEITTFDGRKLTVNSTHHNMADVSKLKEGEDYKLLAWAEKLSPYHLDGWRKDIQCSKEPEVTFYPKINMLAIQSHPEDLEGDSEFNETMGWLKDILEKFMEGKL